jgi:hypothetical protein
VSRDNMLSAQIETARMWTLNEDRRSVRLSLPPIRLAGVPEPLRVSIDLKADMVDEILHRLSVLRAQMLPAPPKPNKRN